MNDPNDSSRVNIFAIYMPYNFSWSFLPSIDSSQLFYIPQCPQWVPLNHIFFQIANMFLLTSSITPESPDTTILRRVLQIFAFSTLSLWGWTIACGLDIMGWSFTLALTNLLSLISTIWRKSGWKLSPDMEQIYGLKFKDLKVTKQQFKVKRM